MVSEGAGGDEKQGIYFAWPYLHLHYGLCTPHMVWTYYCFDPHIRHSFTRELVWKLLVDSGCGEHVLTEARKIISHNTESLYQNSKDHADFISYLLNAGKLTLSLFYLHTSQFKHFKCIV